jgi:O-antigen/teichoic acid export membrane protein
MPQLVQKLLKRHREFIEHVAIMMSGKAISAIIALLTMPFVARLFIPDHFGVAAMFASIAGIVASTASLQYPQAIVLPKAEPEAASILAFAYRIVVSVCVLLLLLLVAYEGTGFEIKSLDLLAGWKWLLPFGVLLLASLFIQETWLTRRKQFRSISVSLVGRNAVTGGSRIAIGTLFGSSIAGLITGYLLGLLCQIVIQAYSAKDGIQRAFARTSISSMRAVAHKYSDFPKFNAPAGLVFALGQHLPILLFGAMFSPTVAGFYAMADRLCQVPVTVVANSVRRVFLQKAAEIRNRHGNLRKAYALSVSAMAAIGAGPFACLWYFGEPLSTWILGDNWLEAGRFLEIIAPWLFVSWSAAPCNAIFVVLRKQKFWLLLTIITTILRLLTFGFAYAVSASPEWTLTAYAIVSTIGSSTNIALAFVLVSQSRPTTKIPSRST